MMNRYFNLIGEMTFSNFLDIAIVSIIIYFVYSKVARTPALPAIQGFFVIIFITLLSSMFKLTTLNYILTNVVSTMLLAVIILFPSEIRSVLYQIRGMRFFRRAMRLENTSLKTLQRTLLFFKKKRIGAIIALQNKDSLRSLIETGVTLRADLESSVLYAIFQKASPLHDGAVVIRDDHIVAAACYIPNLSSAHRIEQKHGTRHRAALALSEQTDAFIIVVSEETGQISIACRSDFFMAVSIGRLAKLLSQYFND